MRIKINGEQPFQVVGANVFAIAPSASGYTLNYSADGENYTAWDEATEADVTQVVANAASGMYFYLAGNTAEGVDIIW